MSEGICKNTDYRDQPSAILIWYNQTLEICTLKKSLLTTYTTPSPHSHINQSPQQWEVGILQNLTAKYNHSYHHHQHHDSSPLFLTVCLSHLVNSTSTMCPESHQFLLFLLLPCWFKPLSPLPRTSATGCQLIMFLYSYPLQSILHNYPNSKNRFTEIYVTSINFTHCKFTFQLFLINLKGWTTFTTI